MLSFERQIRITTLHLHRRTSAACGTLNRSRLHPFQTTTCKTEAQRPGEGVTVYRVPGAVKALPTATAEEEVCLPKRFSSRLRYQRCSALLCAWAGRPLRSAWLRSRSPNSVLLSSDDVIRSATGKRGRVPRRGNRRQWLIGLKPLAGRRPATSSHPAVQLSIIKVVCSNELFDSLAFTQHYSPTHCMLYVLGRACNFT